VARLRDALIAWGPFGLFLLAMVESMGIPNPGGTDAVLLLLTIARPESALACALAATAGSLIGTQVFYEIMRKGGEKLLAKYTSSGRGARFQQWFRRYGLLTVFIAALVPVPILPFKTFAACAGAMDVGRRRFVAVLVAARLPRYSALAYLGAQLGENSTVWLKDHAWHLAAFAVLLFAALYLLVRWVGRARTGTSPV
jgi:membrane protein DedA with SNARE-associated domain